MAVGANGCWAGAPAPLPDTLPATTAINAAKPTTSITPMTTTTIFSARIRLSPPAPLSPWRRVWAA